MQNPREKTGRKIRRSFRDSARSKERQVGVRRQERNEKNWGIKLHLLAPRRHLLVPSQPPLYRRIGVCVAETVDHHCLLVQKAGSPCFNQVRLRENITRLSFNPKDDECPVWLARLSGSRRVALAHCAFAPRISLVREHTRTIPLVSLGRTR